MRTSLPKLLYLTWPFDSRFTPSGLVRFGVDLRATQLENNVLESSLAKVDHQESTSLVVKTLGAFLVNAAHLGISPLYIKQQ